MIIWDYFNPIFVPKLLIRDEWQAKIKNILNQRESKGRRKHVQVNWLQAWLTSRYFYTSKIRLCIILKHTNKYIIILGE